MTKFPQDIIDKTNRLEGAKNDLQKQVEATNARIKSEDDQINQIQQAGAKVVLFPLKWDKITKLDNLVSVGHC